MPSVSIAARQFDAALCAALGVHDLQGVTRITLVIEPNKVTQVCVVRDLMTTAEVIHALSPAKVES